MIQNKKCKACIGDIRVYLQERNSKPNLSCYVNHFLGLTRHSTGRLSEKGYTINSAWYGDLLINTLKPAILTKRLGLLSQNVLHDNVWPYTALLIVETITKFGFDVLQHTAYNPDPLPSDFHIFGILKNALRGRRFRSDKKVCDTVYNCFVSH